MTPKTLKLREKNWNILLTIILAATLGFSYFLEFLMGLSNNAVKPRHSRGGDIRHCWIKIHSEAEVESIC